MNRSALLGLVRPDGSELHVERLDSGHVEIRIARPGELVGESVRLRPRELVAVQAALSKAVARGAR